MATGRDHLKEVLKDLKSQMRGARASSYLEKKADEKSVEPVRKEKPRDNVDLEPEAYEKPSKPSKELMEGPPDFQEEMKKFMSKKNTGRKRVSRVIGGSFEAMAKKPEIKKKG